MSRIARAPHPFAPDSMADYGQTARGAAHTTLSSDIARSVDPLQDDMDEFAGVALTSDRALVFDAAYDIAKALAPDAFATVYRVALSGASDRIYAYCASSSRALSFRDASFRRGKRYASYDVTAVDAIATVSVPDRRSPSSYKCTLCGQRIDDGKPCGCGAR